MVAVKSCRNVGVKVKPNDSVSALSGARFGLPPASVAHWPAGHWWMFPYSVAVTPVWEQSASEREGFAPAQGSVLTRLVLVTDCGVNSSMRFGARIARSKEKRAITSFTGAYSTSNL